MYTVLNSGWNEAIDDYCRQYSVLRMCLVSSEYGRKIIEGVLTLKIHMCGSCVLYLQ